MKSKAKDASITESSHDTERVKLYLEYLNHEMNIMGILSAFCIAVIGLIFTSVVVAKEGLGFIIWNQGQWFICAGSVLLMFGAFCFYEERAELAWHYGQLCLSVQIDRVTNFTTEQIFGSSDDWSTWQPYFQGFAFTYASLILYFFAVISATNSLFNPIETQASIVIFVIFAIGLVYYKKISVLGIKFNAIKTAKEYINILESKDISTLTELNHQIVENLFKTPDDQIDVLEKQNNLLFTILNKMNFLKMLRAKNMILKGYSISVIKNHLNLSDEEVKNLEEISY